MIENGTYKARTHLGLESLLETELEVAGATYLFKSEGAVRFKAAEIELYKFLMHTYVCTGLELELSQPIDIHEADVEKLVSMVNWEDVVPIDSVFSVQAIQNGTTNSALKALAANLQTSIQAYYISKFDQAPRESNEEFPPEFIITLNIELNGSCYLALEAGGASLKERSQTDIKNGITISPALAAGLIKLSGWSVETPFIDPYAGKGTLLIEAARIAKGRTPAFDNDQLLMKKWRTFRHALWKKTREAHFPSIRKDINWIYGSESGKKVFTELHEAIKNIRMTENINLRVVKPDDIFFPQGPGIILTAPPVSANQDMLVNFVKHAKRYGHRYRLGVFTQFHNLDSMVNMKPSEVIKITLEDREFSFMMFDIHNPKLRSDDAIKPVVEKPERPKFKAPERPVRKKYDTGFDRKKGAPSRDFKGPKKFGDRNKKS